MNRSQDIGEDISLLWLFLLVSAKCGHLIRMTSKFLLTGNKNWMDNACDIFPKEGHYPSILHREIQNPQDFGLYYFQNFLFFRPNIPTLLCFQMSTP